MDSKQLAILVPSLGWQATRVEGALHDRRAENADSVLASAEAQLASAAADELICRLPDTASEADIAELEEGLRGAATALGRGTFARTYGSPEEIRTGPAWARTAAQAVGATDGFEEIRTAVAGDPDMAALAAASLLRGVSAQLPKLLEQLEEKGVDPSGEGDREPGEPGSPIWDLQQAMELAMREVAGDIARGLKKAAIAAAGEIAEGRALLNGILPGLGSAPEFAEQSDPRRLALIERLRKDQRLQKVLRIAGRIRRISERVRHVQTEDSKQAIVGLERGGDIARVLPSELAALAGGPSPLRALALKGLAERGLLQSRLSGREPLGRGPIVVMLDASGSMSASMGGLTAIDWASAIGIAAVRAAVEQRRKVAVCSFDSMVGTAIAVDGRDRRAAEEAVFTLATIIASGGTDFTQPISWALDQGAEEERADLIMVTDGFGAIRADLVERLQASRARGLRLWGITIGTAATIGVLQPISDGIASLRGDEEDPAQQIGSLGAL